jgi:hypothetical protein
MSPFLSIVTLISSPHFSPFMLWGSVGQKLEILNNNGSSPGSAGEAAKVRHFPKSERRAIDEALKPWAAKHTKESPIDG